jgi:hypothetical protein
MNWADTYNLGKTGIAQKYVTHYTPAYQSQLPASELYLSKIYRK